MKTKLYLLLLLSTTVSFAQGIGHPRLFFSTSDVSAIEDRINQSGSAANALWGELVEQRERYMNNPQLFTDYGKDRYYENIPALAFSYLITGNQSYADMARHLIFDPNSNPDLQGIIHDNVDLSIPFGIGFRINALALTYDFMYEFLSEGQRDSIRKKIKDEIGRPGVMRDYLESSMNATFQNNHLIHHALPVLIGAMAVYGDDPSIYPTALADADIDLAREVILTGDHSYLKRMWSPDDGAYLEGVKYNFVAVNQMLQFIQLLTRWDEINYFNQSYIEDRLSKNLEWLAYELLPNPRLVDNDSQVGDMFFNNLNQSTYFAPSPSTFLMLSALYPGKGGLGRWLFENTVGSIGNLMRNTGIHWNHYSAYGHSMLLIFPILINYDYVSPTSPSGTLPWSKYFVKNGLVYVRTSSSWADENDVHFSFTSSPVFDPVTGEYSVKHDHADKNSFTLSAYGVHYIVDRGENNHRPEKHNYVLIDDKGQAWSTAATSAAKLRNGKIVSYLKSDKFVSIHGDAKSAFNELYYLDDVTGNWAVASPAPEVNPVLNADRFVHFSREDNGVPPYVIIADDITKDGSTAYPYSFLINSNSSVSSTDPVTLYGGTEKNLRLYYIASSSTTFGTHPTGPYEIRTTAVNPYFHVLMLPFKSGVDVPVSIQPSNITNGTSIRIAWSSYTDYSVLRYGTGTASSSEVTTNAKLSLVRVNNSSGAVASYCLTEGSTLSYSSQSIVDLFGSTGSVMFNDGIVEVSGSISNYSIFAPNASAVRLNEQPVNFTQIGNYVVPYIAPPATPTLVSPANGATGVSVSPTFTWNAASGATSYTLQVSTGYLFPSFAADVSGITGTSYTVNNLDYGTTYYWRVKAVNAGGESAWSSPTWNFTTEIQYFTLTVNSPCGLPTSGADTYQAGTQVQVCVTSTIVSGGSGIQYVFTNWSGDASGTSPCVNVTMDGDKTVNVECKTQYFLTVITSDGEFGTSGQGWYDAGTTATACINSSIITEGETRHLFVGWSGAVSSINFCVDVLMDGPKMVCANYQTQFYLTMTMSGPCGSISPSSDWYNVGDGIEINASTSGNCVFLGWSGSGFGSTSSPYPTAYVEMFEPINQHATFDYACIERSAPPWAYASNDLESAVIVQWGQPSGTCPLSFNIYRQSGWGGNWELIAQGYSGLSMVDYPPPYDYGWNTYYYRIVTVSTTGQEIGEASAEGAMYF